MTPENTSKGLHPSLHTLALYSTGDLHLLTRLQAAYHVARCADCEQQVFLFRSATAELKREARAEALTGFEAVADWSRLEREMLGNIGVGIAAGRCIDKVGRRRVLLSRGAFVAGLMLLFAAGWITHIPREQTDHLAASLQRFVGMERPHIAATVLRTTPEGIAVRAQGATLTIMHPASAVVSLSGASAVSARYVDEETGQVTITKVYGQ